MRYDVWVYIKAGHDLTSGEPAYKSQYFGEVEGDPGEIMDAVKVLFAPDMVGADIAPLDCGKLLEEDND